MACSVNGTGTSICPARGFTLLDGDECPNYDAVECLVFVWLPVIPLRPIHAHSWRGHIYSEVPLRWSVELVFWAFARRWANALMMVGAILAIPHTGTIGGTLAASGGGLALLAAAVWTDRRCQDIRRLLGQHSGGASDPVDWSEEFLASAPLSMELFGTPTDSAAVPALLEKGDYAGAMFAARLTAAREDSDGGQAMTDKILRDPRARAVMERTTRVAVWRQVGIQFCFSATVAILTLLAASALTCAGPTSRAVESSFRFARPSMWEGARTRTAAAVPTVPAHSSRPTDVSVEQIRIGDKESVRLRALPRSPAGGHAPGSCSNHSRGRVPADEYNARAGQYVARLARAVLVASSRIDGEPGYARSALKSARVQHRIEGFDIDCCAIVVPRPDGKGNLWLAYTWDSLDSTSDAQLVDKLMDILRNPFADLAQAQRMP